MRRLSLSLVLAVALLPVARAADGAHETAALRCSAVSMLHSSLTVPSPQFGELMVEVAGLFAEIYSTRVGLRSGTRPALAELKSRRDALLVELRQGWPGNKDKLVREAAACNAWRAGFFAMLPEKPTEKQFKAALEKSVPPAAPPTKDEFDKWAKLTSEAMGAAAIMHAPAKK